MNLNLIKWVDQRKHWWKVFVLIFAVSVSVVGYNGYKTYEYAPLICAHRSRTSASSWTLASRESTRRRNRHRRHAVLRRPSIENLSVHVLARKRARSLLTRIPAGLTVRRYNAAERCTETPLGIRMVIPAASSAMLIFASDRRYSSSRLLNVRWIVHPPCRGH